MALCREGSVVVRGGAVLVRNRPVFSSDSKYIFVSSGYDVKVFSTASGECVRELKGHNGQVTGVAINPHNKLQIFTSSKDGTINQWDYSDAVLLKTLNIASPVLGLFAHHSMQDSLFASILNEKTDKKSQLKLVKIIIPKQVGHRIDVSGRFLIGNVQAGDKGIAFGPRGEFIAAISGCTLKILFLKDMYLKKLSADKKELTCVACHPVDYCIAVGDEIGRISIWRNFHKKELRSREHWHSLRVEDLCYSPEGSALYSVGHECTVVEWHHDSYRKKFLPRQGAPISHITYAPNSQQRALSLMTNAILIQANDKTTQTIQGLVHTNFNHMREGYLPTGLSIDPHTRALVTNGMVGQLQFYHLEQDRLLYSLDITGENYISPADLRQPLMHTEVVKVTFDLQGDWMATLERRDDKQTSPEMTLKFWQFDARKQSFTLNTIISEPHVEKVHCLSFRPPAVSHDTYEPMAVTTSEDGKFKLWVLADDGDSQKKGRSWGCNSVGFFREESPRCGSFSSDGSLLTVSFGHIVTVWDPDMNVLKKTLCHGQKDQFIEHLVFGHGSAAHCLITASSTIMNVWNLHSCNVMWRVNMDVGVLVADTQSEYVAAFDRKGNVFVFHPLESKLAYPMHSLPSADIISAVFIPHTRTIPTDTSDLLPWETQSHLYFVTKSQLLMTVTGNVEKLSADRRTNNVDLQERLPPTPFGMLLNRQHRKGEKEEQGVRMLDLPASANMREMLQSPAHILPPVRSLCSTFLQGLLTPGIKDITRSKSRDSDDSDEDSDFGSDSDETDEDTDTNLASDQTQNYVGQSQDIEHSEDQLQRQVGSVDNVTKTETRIEEINETDVRRLAKVSRSGLKWMQKVFQETY